MSSKPEMDDGMLDKFEAMASLADKSLMAETAYREVMRDFLKQAHSQALNALLLDYRAGDWGNKLTKSIAELDVLNRIEQHVTGLIARGKGARAKLREIDENE